MNRISKLLIAGLLIVVSLAPVGAVSAQEEGLLIWADETRVPILLALGEAFTEEFGVPVEITEMGLGDIRDQILVAGPAGEGPDIIVTVHDHLGQLVANGVLLPLDLTGLEEDYLPSAIDAFTLGGAVYAVPYATENVAFIRNPEIIAEAPATWQELAEIAADLAAEGKIAFALQTGDTYHTFPITTAFGGYIFGFDEEGNYDVNDIGLGSPGGIASAQWLQMMTENGYLVPDTDNDVVFEWYIDGTLGSFITGPWFLDRLRETGQPYVIEGFPGAEGGLEAGRPFSGVWGFAISAFSEQQLLAETFVLDYIATEETMQALYDAQPRPSAFLTVREATEDPDVAAFGAAGADAIPMPSIPEMSAVWTAAGDALNLIIQGSLDGETAYTTAADQIRTTIAGMGAPPSSVTIAGDMQAALGCPGDWQPECEVTFLEDQGDGIWTGAFDIPAGEYQYKCALNASWAEAFGLDGGEDNIPLSLEADATVTFTYDHNENLCSHTVGE